MYNEAKVAEMAAFFLYQAGGKMPYLKLMKLMYLADRASLDRYETPISNDRMVSMPHGPVLSQAYDCMKGASDGPWNDWVADEANYEVSLRKDIRSEDGDVFFELSEADLEIMGEVYEKFSHMGRFEIRDYTHDNCAEWKDPHGSSHAITPYEVFRALGRTDEEAREATGHLVTMRKVNNSMSKYL